ncbi:TPA: RHS domain-containing protein [Citrobacter amalonaticus]|nr:RHS domain-containing protein [Citrobacter amalonaticus]
MHIFEYFTRVYLLTRIEPEYIPERKIHLYHCDHRGLPLVLIDINGRVA